MYKIILQHFHQLIVSISNTRWCISPRNRTYRFRFITEGPFGRYLQTYKAKFENTNMFIRRIFIFIPRRVFVTFAKLVPRGWAPRIDLCRNNVDAFRFQNRSSPCDREICLRKDRATERYRFRPSRQLLGCCSVKSEFAKNYHANSNGWVV